MAANFDAQRMRAKGPIHGTLLIGTTGLWLALATTRDEFEQASEDLAQQMANENVQNGVIILSRELAAITFGPVPEDLISRGITMHRSTESNILAGADAFLDEVFAIQDLSQESLRDLDAVAALELATNATDGIGQAQPQSHP